MTIREKLWGLVDDAMNWQAMANEMGADDEKIGEAAALSLGAQIEGILEEDLIVVDLKNLTNGTLWCVLNESGVDVSKYKLNYEECFDNEVDNFRLGNYDYEEQLQHIQPEEVLEAKRVIEKKWDDMRNVLRDEVVLW